jgi:hypothetical protein
MTDAQLIDPVKNILINGVETPRVINNGDGTVTWNLKAETANRMANMVIMNALSGLLGGRKAPGNGLSDLLGGGKF